MKVPAALLVLLAVWAAPAQASLSLCNRTSYVLYAATAAGDGTQSEARGWARIVPGECQAVRSEPLSAKTYLVHARSSLGHSGPARSWGGGLSVCVKNADFVLRQKMAGAVCTADDSFALPFAVVPNGRKRSWTMTFDEAPIYPTLLAAQLAGVKRLLKDNGYAVGAIDGRPSKQTGAALAAFRKKMQFPPQATNADLFNALEAQAMQRVTPAGYTVCNDTRNMLLVALARGVKGIFSTHGWWKIPAKACARDRKSVV